MPSASSSIFMLVDMESFYASVEIARNPELKGKPVVVCGDPQQRRGIVLAASREAKAYGINTGMGGWECGRLCPHVVMVRPRMQLYMEVSVQLTGILERFTDRLYPYSVDEQFLEVTGCEKLFGPPREMARRIIQAVRKETGVNCRVGIGDNPLQAKMACDCFAKKSEEGIFRLGQENYSALVWPLPVGKLFGVGARMERNLFRIGVRKIGHLAALSREELLRRWGVNGEVLWLNAHGIDYSTVASAERGERGVSHSVTLPRDYRKPEELEVALLEITDEVCRRSRGAEALGQVVSVYCRGADFHFPTGFSRQRKLPLPTAFTDDVYPLVRGLFYENWNRLPVRKLGVALSRLMPETPVQLSLFQDGQRKESLYRAVDGIRDRYGAVSLFRLSSLQPGGILFQRAGKIGGHEA